MIVFGAATALLTQTGFGQSGSVDTTFMRRVGPDGAVNAVVAQTNGMVVFGGAFTNVNFTPFNHLARADTNGDVDASFAIGTGPDAAVNALALQGDGKLLVAGAFTKFNGVARHGLVRVNGNGSVDSSFNTGAGPDGPVNWVAWQTNGQVLIQGVFSNYNGTPRLSLARLNANGSLDPAFDPGDRAANVSALAWQADGKVVFSGGFTSLDGITATNLARLNADGPLDTNFCAAASADSYALSLVLQPDGRILLSGRFANVNGVTRRGVARLNADGTLDTDFDPGTGFAGGTGPGNARGRVYLALQPDGAILTWGNYTSFNGTNRTGAARLTATGSLDLAYNPAWGPGTGYANAVAFLSDGRFITGGSSSSFGYLTRRKSDGTTDLWMNETGADGDVYALLWQTDGKVVLGGSFTHVNGFARTNLARLNADGSVDTSFTAGTTLAIPGGDEAWVPALALEADGKILLGGAFTNIAGVACSNLARLNSDGTVDTNFVANVGYPGSYSEVDALCVQPDGKVLVGGWFAQVNGAAATNLARLNADGSLDATFQPAALNGEVWSLALQEDGKLLVGGDIGVAGTSQKFLARLNADGGLDTSFAPTSFEPYNSYAVYSLAIQPDGRILAGGDFRITNSTAENMLARFNSDGSLDATFAPQANNQINALWLQPDGKVLAGGEFTVVGGSYHYGLIRLNASGTLDNTFDCGWGTALSANSWGRVYCLTPGPDGRVLVGGSFPYFNLLARGRIVQLTNDVAAAITAPPPHYVTTAPGSNVTLSVATAGTSPLSYQWLFNGVNIPGQTNSACQLASVSAAQAGYYTLIVSNAFGAVTIAPVYLAVVSSSGPGSISVHAAAGSGPDAGVWTIAEQPDGKLLIGGNFTNFNGVLHRGLVRLNPDGSFDTNFLASAGVNDWGQVYNLLPQPDGNILVGGWFDHVNGVPCGGLARLNADGTLDTNFNASIDGWAWPMALQTDGKILVGGAFGHADGVARNNIARFNADGSLDTTFDPGAGADNYTGAVLVQPDGRILVGGIFGYFNGVFGGIVRLNTNGTVDPVFTNHCAGIGAEDRFGMINEFALQPDGKILVAGWFDDFNHTARTNLVRLNPDGSLDSTFVPAPLNWLTTSGQLYGLALQPDGKIVIGFWPTNTPAGGPCVARLKADGSLDSTFQIGSCSADGIWYLKRLADGEIVVGGGFPDFNGAATSYLAWLQGDIAPFSLGLHWSSSQLELGLFGEAGRTYTIEAATSLPQFTAWTNVTSTGTNWLPVPARPQQFFRARTGP